VKKVVDLFVQFDILPILIERGNIMLKYENLAEVGMVIRGYDFFGSKGAYIEGKVIAKGEIVVDGRYHFDGYTIMVEKDGAEFGREGEEAYIPFETSMDYDGRVELIDTCDNDAEYNLAVQMMQEVA
jgi:hypothetical protein